MKWFGRFRRTPPPTPDAVREALSIATYGVEPELSPKEFESLYDKIWKAENDGNKDASTIINDFVEQRKLELESVEYYQRTAQIIIKDDGSQCVEVGLHGEYDQDATQYILHEILNTIGRIEMDIACDRESTVEAFIKDQKKSTFVITPHGS